MKHEPESLSHEAFTRLDAMMLLGAFALVACIALPVLAGNGFRAEQVGCVNNLRQIGHAFHLWANEHGDNNQWWVSIDNGGTYLPPRGYATPTPPWANMRNNAWFPMSWISNELGTPKILVCPGDRGVGPSRQVASDFSSNPDGGFLNPNYKNRAVSYLVGLHSIFASPRSILSGDRNLRWSAAPGMCSAGVGLVQVVTDNPVVWTNAIHGVTGNLLFTDGSIEQLSNLGLRHAASDTLAQLDNGSDHYISPP